MAAGSSHGPEKRGRAAEPAAMFDPCFEPMAAIVRGRVVESVHRGAMAVVGTDGTLVGGIGDPGTYVLLRSTAKPFQAAAVVARGVAEAFSLTDEEVAVMAASHSGAPEHVELVNRLLAHADLSPAALVCGSVEHMCSGKHAGMLLLARHMGVEGEGYERPDHPVQREIEGYMLSLLGRYPAHRRRTAAGQSAGAGSGALFNGTDGCGVPVLGMALQEAAWLFSLLAEGATPALARVRDSMRSHPLLVAGAGRLDTDLLRTGGGRIVAKGGAEGVQGLGLVDARSGGSTGSLGCVIKVEDGSGRSIPVVAAALLRAWGESGAARDTERDHPAAILDGTGAEVARIQALVEPARLRPGPGVVGLSAESRSVAGEAPPTRGAGSSAGEPGPVTRRLFARKGERLTVSRGDEKDVLSFFREQWPSVDRQYFGREVEWSADPFTLVLHRDGKVIAALRGHFIGGVASVDELMVVEGLRGVGIGSNLLGRFEDEARKRRCSRIVLRAVKGSPAEGFYRRRGYHRECVQYGYEFGYDYVRLTCGAEQALGEAGRSTGESKGGP